MTGSGVEKTALAQFAAFLRPDIGVLMMEEVVLSEAGASEDVSASSARGPIEEEDTRGPRRGVRAEEASVMTGSSTDPSSPSEIFASHLFAL